MRTTPHDAFFKRIMRDRGVAREELRAALPSDLAAQLDWSTLAVDDSAFVDEDGGYRHADLVFTCRLHDGGDAVLDFVLEHQSGVDRWMPLRGLGYSVRHLERAVERDPGREDLPMVVAVVLHQGRRPWAGPRSLDDLYRAPTRLDESVGTRTPRLQLVIDDLAARSEAEIVDAVHGALAKLALSVMRAVRLDQDPLAVLDRTGPLLREVRDGPDGHDACEEFIRYLAEVRDADLDDVKQRVARIDRRLEDDVMTLAERLRNEGRKEGRQEGRTDGRVEMLLSLVAARFGEADAGVRARVHAADLSTLDRWAVQVLTATSVDEALR
jgi:predicted transposase YdaD